jgi:hypothetical protein
MSPVGSSIQPFRARREAVDLASDQWISTKVYRSRAVAPLSAPDLRRLLERARARNRANGISGLLVHDNGCFFQWLEGPEDALERTWEAILRDPRHTGIEVLRERSVPVRFFGDWDLKLATRRGTADLVHPDVLRTPAELIDRMHRSPEAVPLLLGTLAPPAIAVAGSAHVGTGAPSGTARARRALTLVERVVEATVIPELLEKHARPPAPPSSPELRVAELARLLIASDPKAAFDLINGVCARGGSVMSAYSSLFEPVARSLGDLWDADDCQDYEVTLGLCRLQSALRHNSIGLVPVAAQGLIPPVVLVAPQPGEPHTLSAALDSEALWQAGWNPQNEYPATDDALQQLVADRWFDALDLSLSPAFKREHGLPRTAEIIAHARSASRNPALIVVVGGRMFHEHQDAGIRVGADAGSPSAAQVGPLILQALHRDGSE